MELDISGKSSVYLTLFKTKKDKTTLQESIYINTENTVFNILADTVTCSVQACRIKYDMGMYAPDHFDVKLKLNAQSGSIPMTTVAEKLMGLKAEVTFVPSSGKNGTLSKGLIVYKATPTSGDNGSTSTIYVTLDIYSSDKLLDLSKFSQSFTGLPLGTIISNNISKFVPKTDTAYELKLVSNKQILGYDSSREVIQPYLVQYNETFRSMINRSANRCGEFLYWHDGKLQYGLHSVTSDPINIGSSISNFSLAMPTASILDAMPASDTHRSGNGKADDDKAASVNYDLETGMPDFNETVSFSCGNRGYWGYKDSRMYGANFGLKYITNTDDKNYGDIDGEKSDSMSYVIGKLLTNYAKAGFIIDFITDTITDIVVGGYMANMKKAQDADDAKQKVNHKRFNSEDAGDKFAFVKEEQTNFSSMIKSDGSISGISGKRYKDCDTMETEYKIAPFSTLKMAINNPTNDLFDGQVLGNDFYSKIRSYGKTAANQAIDVSLTVTAPTLKIGDRIMVNATTYVITAINCNCDVETNVQGTSGTYKFTASIHAIPCVYSYYGRKFFIPESLPEQNRVMDGNSTAIVMDNTDPYGQGRVRVRFNWQGKVDVKLSADDETRCHNDALKYVYDHSSSYENEKDYNADTDSPIRVHKSDICQLIVENKISLRKAELERELYNEEKSQCVPHDEDKFYVRYVSGKYDSVSMTGTPDDPNVKEYTWKDILDIEDRLKQVSTQEKKNKKKKLADATLDKKKEDSTPWIRMASQLASEKAKAYMKPNVGDEVIIGFENGNPERPYVLGSLFNGTAKAPSATYSITGNNGESFTMEDEDMSVADLVGKLISPVAKTIMNKLIDKGGEDKHVGKQVYPVGGKISLKDKYGFYSLSMSSADRKIDIKCPLGDISISAFTGITLSAPNGDINIKGKNVNITAGDKITLTSGTNKDIYAWSPTELPGIIAKTAVNIAATAMKTFVGDYKVIDLSLLRSVWEVMCRPLNGTTLIQSKRHLLLQAGNGNAELPLDAISASDPHHAIDVFPNYPFFLLKGVVQKFKEQYTGYQQTIMSELTNLTIAVANARDDVDAIDNGNPQFDVFANAIKKHNPALNKLAKGSIEFILNNITGNNGIFTIPTNTLLSRCPYPNHSMVAGGREAWKEQAAAVATSAANIAGANYNIKALIDNLKNSPAIKSAVKALNNSYVMKKAWGPANKISVDSIFEGIDANNFKIYYELGARIETFNIKNFVGSDAKADNYLQLVTGVEDIKYHLNYNIIKVLYKQGVVSYLADGEEFLTGKKRYKVTDLPEWDADNTCVTGFDADEIGFKDFLARVVPTASIEPVGLGAMFAKAFKNEINNLLNDSLDMKNINWMLHQERNLWDAKSHPGLILMSDEKGLNTMTLTGDGKFEATQNTSLNSVLTAMGKDKPKAATADEIAKNLCQLHVRKRQSVGEFVNNSGISAKRTVIADKPADDGNKPAGN